MEGLAVCPLHIGPHAIDILRDFRGILPVDGDTGFDALAEPQRVGSMPLTLAYCWARTRRKPHDIYQKDGSEIAAKVMGRIAQILKVEIGRRGCDHAASLQAELL